jgi:hypothetical protein
MVAIQSTPRTVPAEDPIPGLLPHDPDEFIDPDDDEDCRAGLFDLGPIEDDED